MEDQRGRPVAWLKGETGWFWHQVRAARKQWLLAGVHQAPRLGRRPGEGPRRGHLRHHGAPPRSQAHQGLEPHGAGLLG
eukprot:8494228-Alexandrium_andersonii.AAC.1